MPAVAVSSPTWDSPTEVSVVLVARIAVKPLSLKCAYFTSLVRASMLCIAWAKPVMGPTMSQSGGMS